VTVVQYFTTLRSPVGELIVAGDGEAVTGVGFAARGARRGFVVTDDWVEDAAPLAAVTDQLSAYFAGERRDFDLLLRPSGTAFQRRVWDAVVAVPYGRTTTYGELAAGLGRPRSARAVGAANGANPLAIVIPCHRIVGADRGLAGYGGGLAAKRFLLALECGSNSA
jgi:methylated-DNA-[protein]-cysteine S-methyltransferase